jgi:hypothetical protein
MSYVLPLSPLFYNMEDWIRRTRSLIVPGHARNGTITERTGSRPSSRNNTNKDYVYDTLRTDISHIRLVKLWRGQTYPWSRISDSEFGCGIEIFEASKAPRYVALSYTWGDPTPSHQIWLNGQRYCIRANLYDFLQSFSRTERDQPYLWIDQLCINQANTQERSHQVGMMANIYWNSDFVISWLGLESLEAVDGFTGYPFSPSYESIRSLLQNSYFTRLWIVQEVLLAKRIYIVCGELWVEWNDITRVITALEAHLFDSLPDARWLFRDSKRPSDSADRKRPRFSLYQAIHRYSGLNCGDIRDKVYGLLGLVDSSYGIPLVNYASSPRQVYTDTVEVLLTRWSPAGYEELLDAARALSRNLGLRPKHIKALDFLWSDVAEFELAVRRPYTFVVSAFGFEQSTPGLPDRWWVRIEDWKRYYAPDGRPAGSKNLGWVRVPFREW